MGPVRGINQRRDYPKYDWEKKKTPKKKKKLYEKVLLSSLSRVGRETDLDWGD